MNNNSLILVAEDEADIADILIACLRRRGDTPVLMLPANDDDADQLAALRIGPGRGQSHYRSA